MKTSSLAEARKLRTVEDLKLDASFSAAAEKKAAASESWADYQTNVSLDTLIDYVRKHVNEVDRQKAETFAVDPPADQSERRELWSTLTCKGILLPTPEDPNRATRVDITKRRVLAQGGATIVGRSAVR